MHVVILHAVNTHLRKSYKNPMKNRMPCEKMVGTDLHIGYIPTAAIQEPNTQNLTHSEMHSAMSVCRNAQISLVFVVWV